MKTKNRRKRGREIILLAFPHPSSSLIGGTVQYRGLLGPSSLDLYGGIPDVEVGKHPHAFP